MNWDWRAVVRGMRLDAIRHAIERSEREGAECVVGSGYKRHEVRAGVGSAYAVVCPSRGESLPDWAREVGRAVGGVFTEKERAI